MDWLQHQFVEQALYSIKHGLCIEDLHRGCELRARGLDPTATQIPVEDEHAVTKERLARYRSLCTQMYDLLCWLDREGYDLWTGPRENVDAFMAEWYQVKASYEQEEHEPPH